MMLQAAGVRQSATTNIAVLFSLLCAFAAVAVSAYAGSDCQGKVGVYAYDLGPLASKIGAVDLQATDSSNQVYYYRVCGVVSSSFCQTVTDNTPAMCQKDSRIPAQYHDCGSQRTAKFGQLPNANEQDGFTLSFTGGEEDRAGVVYFVCDPNTENGVLTFFKEDPVKTYNLKYVSKYACPINSDPTPTPTPTPPSRDDLCCLYLYNRDPSVTKTLCSTACPPSFNGYSFESNWTVSACSDCFFHRK